MTDTKFYANFSFGRPTLAEFALEKETKKSYMVDHSRIEHLIGRSYFPKRLSKDRYMVFDDLGDALNYLLDECVSHLKHLESQHEALDEQTQAIRKSLVLADRLEGKIRIEG